MISSCLEEPVYPLDECLSSYFEGDELVDSESQLQA
jgi:hypothetical protein